MPDVFRSNSQRQHINMEEQHDHAGCMKCPVHCYVQQTEGNLETSYAACVVCGRPKHTSAATGSHTGKHDLEDARGNTLDECTTCSPMYTFLKPWNTVSRARSSRCLDSCSHRVAWYLHTALAQLETVEGAKCLQQQGTVHCSSYVYAVVGILTCE